VTFSRVLSTSSLRAEQQPPSQRASEILEKVPSSPSLITKTGTVVLGTGALATAISQELYVVNEETVVAIGTFIILGYIIKVSG
jgi:F-type H+-transporting ATPase subunit b